MGFSLIAIHLRHQTDVIKVTFVPPPGPQLEKGRSNGIPDSSVRPKNCVVTSSARESGSSVGNTPEILTGFLFPVRPHCGLILSPHDCLIFGPHFTLTAGESVRINQAVDFRWQNQKKIAKSMNRSSISRWRVRGGHGSSCSAVNDKTPLTSTDEYRIDSRVIVSHGGSGGGSHA